MFFFGQNKETWFHPFGHNVQIIIQRLDLHNNARTRGEIKVDNLQTAAITLFQVVCCSHSFAYDHRLRRKSMRMLNSAK